MSGYFRWFGLPGSFVLTCLMSLLALTLAIVFRTKDRWLCFAAMLISTVGDILLMNFMDLKQWLPNYFYVGAAVFIIAHFVYIAAFSYLIKTSGYSIKGAGLYTALAVVAAAFVFFTAVTVRNGSFDIASCVLSAVYLMVIGADIAAVFIFAFNEAKNGRVWRLISVIGVLSFFISDCFIGLDILGGINSFGHLIWWYYPIGQILLLIGG